jgi:hypothetical protein
MSESEQPDRQEARHRFRITLVRVLLVQLITLLLLGLMQHHFSH